MRRPAVLAGLLSLMVVFAGVVYGTWVAGGMDSLGYVSQSDRWLSGPLIVPQPGIDAIPWPNALQTIVPLGYVPSPDGRGSAPYYSPGLSMLMALARLVAGYCAVFWVVPLCGGLLVASTFVIGRHVRSEAVGLAAAALVATSPVVLFMSTAPMSDLPAAAFWALSLAAALVPGRVSTGRAIAAGAAAGVSILIRPNLVVIAALIALYLLLRAGRPRRDDVRAVVAFSAAVVPAALFIAWINTVWYGAPTKSGPGDLAGDLFSAANIAANFVLYPTWFVTTQTPLAVAGVAALFLPLRRIWRTRENVAIAVLFAAMFVVTLFMHSLFIPLDEWWYLRYLLVLWPPIFVGLGMVWSLAWESARPGLRLGSVVVLIGLCLVGLRIATLRNSFANGPMERRYVEAARLLSGHTKPDAVIFSYQHSATARYYGGRMTVRYEWVPREWLGRAVAWLESQGRHPYALLEEWELERFREHYAGQGAIGALDRRLIFVSRSAGPDVYLYDLLQPGDGSGPTIRARDLSARCEHPAPPPDVTLTR